ncbi:hypothetical protein MSAN_00878600 [Mycena sanguinolenta]|uniref:Uncharacterized protein n=1 Tax=Mycena sanguinolenta TaxID=230812 RepID=A0A8H6YX90_9AGAR|nr:hypothetical protein MSAN_00878600 [Mycena sanguinolenta]
MSRARRPLAHSRCRFAESPTRRLAQSPHRRRARLASSRARLRHAINVIVDLDDLRRNRRCVPPALLTIEPACSRLCFPRRYTPSHSSKLPVPCASSVVFSSAHPPSSWALVCIAVVFEIQAPLRGHSAFLAELPHRATAAIEKRGRAVSPSRTRPPATNPRQFGLDAMLFLAVACTLRGCLSIIYPTELGFSDRFPSWVSPAKPRTDALVPRL